MRRKHVWKHFSFPLTCVFSVWWQQGKNWVSAGSHAMVGLPDVNNITLSLTNKNYRNIIFQVGLFCEFRRERDDV